MHGLHEIEVGTVRLRLVKVASGYVARAFEGSRIVLTLEGSDPDRLWTELQVQVERLLPGWFGYAGARARFLHWFADGFASQAYLADERLPKLAARDMLLELAPLDQAVTGSGYAGSVLRVFQKENLLYPIEKAKLGDLLRGPDGDSFVRAAARFARGDGAPALQALDNLLRPHGIASWTVVTYLPFLWRPDTHMFLKPEVTRDFARRVNHRLARTYSAELKPPVYADLIDLAGEIRQSVLDLGPRDMIDVQGVLMVVQHYQTANAQPRP